jgi:CheY-like chemotaxis protein
MATGTPAVTRILVADGDATIRAAYISSLRQDSRDIIEAADGRDALVKALVRVPALVVTELDLPLIVGFTLCEILRRDRMTTDVPIVVATDRRDPADIRHARRVGADAVLAKSPVEAVTGEVARLLMEGRALRARSTTVLERAAQQQDRSAQLLVASVERPSTRGTHQPIVTTHRPLPPPSLSCPNCARPLTYEQSSSGGVTTRQIEQWDYLTCANACGRFQYRRRTRKLRQVS